MTARMQGYGWCGLYRSFSSSSCTKNYDMRAHRRPCTLHLCPPLAAGRGQA